MPPIRYAALTMLSLAVLLAAGSAGAAMVDHPVVKLRSLDKVTARTMTFEARVGSTVKFGNIYIRVQACRKAEPIDPPESASFLQVWEVAPEGESRWVFSGWMFASSPALSPMDHPVYDVWVLDCLERRSDDPPADPVPDMSADQKHSDDGEVTGADALPPQDAPPQQRKPRVELPGETP